MELTDCLRSRFELSLRNDFDLASVEDGICHPAEQTIAAALDASGKDLEWLHGLVRDADSPIFAASVLRCLGRLDAVGTTAWRTRLVQDALDNEDVQVRDAALQVAEAWGGGAMCQVLAAHLPAEPVGWLREAMQDACRELAGLALDESRLPDPLRRGRGGAR